MPGRKRQPQPGAGLRGLAAALQGRRRRRDAPNDASDPRDEAIAEAGGHQGVGPQIHAVLHRRQPHSDAGDRRDRKEVPRRSRGGPARNFRREDLLGSGTGSVDPVHVDDPGTRRRCLQSSRCSSGGPRRNLRIFVETRKGGIHPGANAPHAGKERLRSCCHCRRKGISQAFARGQYGRIQGQILHSASRTAPSRKGRFCAGKGLSLHLFNIHHSRG
mmetsp:Transcript_5356/g.13454  ORF Transcript_5356/g.13454 Transcript_5356/m.13454 type:complete len:217 (+) Transcript_5356:362-1012(+)